MNLFSHLFKSGSILNHFIGYTGKCLYVPRNVLPGINQRLKLLYNFLAIKYLNRDLNYAIRCCIAAGCFNIYNCIHHSGVILKNWKERRSSKKISNGATFWQIFNVSEQIGKSIQAFKQTGYTAKHYLL